MNITKFHINNLQFNFFSFTHLNLRGAGGKGGEGGARKVQDKH